VLEERLRSNNDDVSNTPELCWISYTLLGITTQSTTFLATKDPDFKPVIAEYLLYGSLQEIYQRLTDVDESSISINICTHNTILSTATLNIGRDLFISKSEKENNIETYSYTGTLYFEGAKNDEASISVSSLDESSDESKRMRLTFTVLLRQIHEEEISSESNVDQDHADHKSYEWIGKSIALEAKRIDEREKSLRSKQKKFDEYVRAKDIEFNDHVKMKERELKSMIEQEASKIEHELFDLFESSRREYKDLENKLREKLSKVEAKERQLESASVNQEAAFMRRSAELDLKIKLAIEESSHKVGMEVSSFPSFVISMRL